MQKIYNRVYRFIGTALVVTMDEQAFGWTDVIMYRHPVS